MKVLEEEERSINQAVCEKFHIFEVTGLFDWLCKLQFMMEDENSTFFN